MFQCSDCLKQVSFDIYVNLKATRPGRLVVTHVSEGLDAFDCRVVSDFIKGAQKTPKSGHTYALPTGGTNSRLVAQHSSCSIHSDNKHDVILIPSSPFTPVACSVIIRTNRVIPLSILRGLSLEELLVSSFVFVLV